MAPGCCLASHPVAGSHLKLGCCTSACSQDSDSSESLALEYQLLKPSASGRVGSNSSGFSRGPAGRFALMAFGLVSLRTALCLAAPLRNIRTTEWGLNPPLSMAVTATTLALIDLLTTKKSYVFPLQVGCQSA